MFVRVERLYDVTAMGRFAREYEYWVGRPSPRSVGRPARRRRALASERAPPWVTRAREHGFGEER